MSLAGYLTDLDHMDQTRARAARAVIDSSMALVQPSNPDEGAQKQVLKSIQSHNASFAKNSSQLLAAIQEYLGETTNDAKATDDAENALTFALHNLACLYEHEKFHNMEKKAQDDFHDQAHKSFVAALDAAKPLVESVVSHAKDLWTSDQGWLGRIKDMVLNSKNGLTSSTLDYLGFADS